MTDYKRYKDGVLVETGTLPDPLPPPDPADIAETFMQTPFGRAWVTRQARKENKTTRQIIQEIRDDT